jgi:predicted oxidoreductase
MTEGMNKVRLGGADLMVTPVCFGTSGLGDMPDTYGYAVDVERAKATVEAIFDGPVNFIDTSRIYGMGRSEERIGAVIRERGGLPAGFVVSTKLDRDPETNRFDATQARRSLEQSLKALGLERIDVLHLHDPEHARSPIEATARDGALGELFRIKEEGLAKAVGLAAGRVDMMLPLLSDWDFDALITHNASPSPTATRSRCSISPRRGGSRSSTPPPMRAGFSPRDRANIPAMSIRRRQIRRSIRSAGSRRSAPATACRPGPRRSSFRCATRG